jgi:branched-chain amino acid transport system substrate-binding protein
MTKAPKRVLAAVLAAAFAATTMAGCTAPSGGTTATTTKTTEVRVGFAAPLTGDNAVYGEGMRRAVQLAIDEANADAATTKAGYKFVLVAQDDQGDPKQAVNAANALVADKGVVALVGHFNSGCSIPASAVYNPAGLAMVSVSSNPALTAQGFKIVNRIVAKDDVQGAVAAKLVKSLVPSAKVAIIDDSTPYGEGLAAEFKKGFEAAGGAVALHEKIQPKEVDFKALVVRIKTLGVGAIYYGGAYAEGALIAKQAREAGVAAPLIGGDMIYSDEFIKLAVAANAEGDYCTSLGFPIDQQPGGPAFTAAYAKAYDGAKPEAYDTYAYDAAKIIIKAAIEVGPDRAKVAAAIRGITLDGVTGKTSFDANGDTTNPAISVYKVTGGKWGQYKF